MSSTMPVYYLPSTQVHTSVNPELHAVYAATQRATLRHNLWCDNKHLQGRNSGTLHPNHIAFLTELAQDSASPNSHCEQFVDSTFNDVLDAVCFRCYILTPLTNFLYQLVALDRLDGGFSFLVRVPGVPPTKTDWKVDCYSPPREMLDPTVQHHIRTLIEYFMKNIAPCHIQEIHARSLFSPDVTITAISDGVETSHQLFPSPIIPGTSHYQYIYHNLGTLFNHANDESSRTAMTPIPRKACQVNSLIIINCTHSSFVLLLSENHNLPWFLARAS
jgi:hypothetical protein